MIDQTNEQNPPPVSQPTPAAPSVTPAVSEPYSPPVQETSSFTPPAPPESPTVAVSGEGGVPKWFYLVFGITLIVFFAVTTLLILSLTGKKQPPASTPAELVQPTVFTRPTEVILPSPTVAVPQASNDEISALEKDLDSTDMKEMDEDLSTFDSELSAP